MGYPCEEFRFLPARLLGLVLGVPEFGFRLFPLRDVAHDRAERWRNPEPFPLAVNSADRQEQRQASSRPDVRRHLPSVVEDGCEPGIGQGRQIVAEYIARVRREKFGETPSENERFRLAEDRFGPGAERADTSFRIKRYDPVACCIQYRTKLGIVRLPADVLGSFVCRRCWNRGR